MIEGTDTVFNVAGESAAMEAATRLLCRQWPEACYTDIETGSRFQRMEQIPFGQITELMVYNSADAERVWDEAKDPEENSTVLFIGRKQDFTVVCDNPLAPDMRSFLDSLRTLFCSLKGLVW